MFGVLCFSGLKLWSFSVLMLNMQQAWNVSARFMRSDCSGSGGQGNVEELKLSRRNGTWPLRLAVRDSFWLSVKKSAFSAAGLQKLYHTLAGELHTMEIWRGLFLSSCDQSKFKLLLFLLCISDDLMHSKNNYHTLFSYFSAPIQAHLWMFNYRLNY